MADDPDATLSDNAPPALEAPVSPKKQRRPRTKKASPDAATADTAAGASGNIGTTKKRGRKPKLAMGGAVTKRRSKRSPQDEQTAPIGASAGDEMADLLQLEEENRRLRALLADKLRAENADLRKKLKLD